MRIISGMARGIRLSVPETGGVRPTEDKVKESLFSTLGDLRGKRVLDLFSGSGSLGLEALSRGAERVVLVERDPRHCQTIRENLARVVKAMGGVEPGTVELLSCDAARAGARLAAEPPFDFLLADPPYHCAPGDYGACALLADPAWTRLAAPGAILVLEQETGTLDVPWAPLSPWRLLRERSFGIRTLSYATPAEAAAGERK